MPKEHLIKVSYRVGQAMFWRGTPCSIIEDEVYRLNGHSSFPVEEVIDQKTVGNEDVFLTKTGWYALDKESYKILHDDVYINKHEFSRLMKLIKYRVSKVRAEMEERQFHAVDVRPSHSERHQINDKINKAVNAARKPTITDLRKIGLDV